jgi:death-on-curing family protein
MTIGLTFDSVETAVQTLQSKSFEEPVPSFSFCNLNKLESSLKTPFQRPILKSERSDFCEKAALLFCLLIENHAFPNANKRIAVVSLVTMADINGYKLNMSDIRLYAMAMSVTLLAKYELFNEAVDEVEKMLEDLLSRKPGKPMGANKVNQLRNGFKQFLKS